MIKIYPAKTKVTISDKKIPAIILGALIKGDYIMYEVAWWDGASRKTEYLAEGEFTIKSNKDETQTIGFNNIEGG